MKKILTFAMFLGAVMALAMPCCAEEVAFQFDGREWGLGYSDENEFEGIQEYVLLGETVNHWTELVTIQAFFGLQEKTTPAKYMDGMMEQLKKICPNIMVRTVRQGENDVMLEWEVKDCPGQENQYEIDRIISGKKAIWYLHYATKKLPILPERRDKWMILLNAATLESP